MTVLARLIRDESGSSAAEFALVLPIFLIFLLGLIDVGRYSWAVNQAEKATQIGARWAVVTDLIPTGLINYSFATNGVTPQGTPVNDTAFPGVHCASTGGAVTCTCNASCPFDPAPDADGQTAFNSIVARMRSVYPRLSADDVEVDYLNSGLGFSGDPNGPDVAPFVRISLHNQRYPLFMMLGNDVSLPSFAYALTMEDGAGTYANY